MYRARTRRARFWTAAGCSFERGGEAAVGFTEYDFGEGTAAVALGQGGGVSSDVGGHGAGVPGELEGDLLVVAGGEVRVVPREDGGHEGFVRGAVQGQSGLARGGRGARCGCRSSGARRVVVLAVAAGAGMRGLDGEEAGVAGVGVLQGGGGCLAEAGRLQAAAFG